MSEYDAELEELKRRRMEALLRKLEEQKKKEEEMTREAQRQAILRRILTQRARERLANVKLVRPELATAVEDYLINLALSGQLRSQVDEPTLKEILIALDSKTRRDYRITIRRKSGD